MPICTSCNVEFEEDKKFCSYCGGPLKPKPEPMSAPKNVNRADEEKPEGKLYCPHCKITYQFGSSCIQCGAPLGRQAPPQEKEESEVARETQSEGKVPSVAPPQEQKSGTPRGKLICPTCKIIYERGTSCIKCESALVPQNSTQTDGKPGISSESEKEGKPLPLQGQVIEEQLVAEVVVETPRKKLICPSCKIIYERGTSCVRCGAALVLQTSSKEKVELPDTKEREKPKSSDIEFNLPPSEPDGLQDPFLQRGSAELSVASDQRPEAGLERPSSSGTARPKEKDSPAAERVKKKESRTTRAQELGIDEDFFQDETPEPSAAKRSKGDSIKIFSLLDRLKKDYRRLGLEAGGIVIMVVAGGWLLLSVYSYFTKPKPPEPRAAAPKEVAVRISPRPASLPPPPVTTAVESRESKNTGAPAPLSNESPSAPSPLPEPSRTAPTEAQAAEHIKTLLENVRQSNLKKDIDLFVSCYASDFENMEGRKKATVAYWEKFNYLDLSYDVRNLSISAETAKAKVEWLIKTSSKGGGQYQENKSVLDVAFRKENGKWKIREVKPTK